MANPFRRPRTEDDRRSLWERLTAPSEAELDEANEELQKARQYKEWRGMPFAALFDRWLEEQAHRPVDIGESLTMVAAATRSNTFREIMQYLKTMDEKSSIALGD